MLRQQLRALLRAAAGRRLRVMFPMVAEVAEFVAAREVLGVEVRRAEARCLPLPAEMRIGVMLEVPALLWQLGSLLPEVDFVSVGSNDLMQFLFACDRGNPNLAGRYDPLSPAMLSLLAELVRQCDRHKVPLSLCGEMAGSPLEAMALLGIGFRNLSMAPASFGPVKAMVRSLQLAPLEQFLAMHIGAPDHSLRSKMSGFAHDHGVVI
jgi:phosphotransferase system enzyme I (PtsP)